MGELYLEVSADFYEYENAIAQLLQEFESLQEMFGELEALGTAKDELCAALSLHAIAHTIYIGFALIAQIVPFIVFSPRWYTAATGT
ncbi:MAG: hypothetical protein IKK75_03585 [Clostridia bacterium]|nr:hypothetical protein [Clostridia bacterium]